MQVASFFENLEFNDQHVAITPMLESGFTKEIRIAFKEGQIMKEHKTGYPITVMVLKGEIEFGLPEETVLLKSGDLIALEPNVVHSLKANEESVVRLSLSKNDTVQRVNAVLNL
ncbi:MAG: cupin domain-containing protein [Hydrogenimonas sp.]|nr:cupin domain-containing protein [Hydrogenimonas sp.]